MSLKEQTIILTDKDSQGNTIMQFPITKAKNIEDVISIAQGGTGQTTASGVRNALGLGNTTGALPIANGGTGANNASEACANIGALPTAGGVMTGSIKFNTSEKCQINRTTDDKYIHIGGGTNVDDGAVLALYGQNLSAETIDIGEFAVGGFALQTKKITGDDDGLNYYTLLGSPNGILSWKQKPVETVYYDNGNLIRYSNGLQIICGGFSYVNSETYIIFPLPFVNASYKIVPISINNNGFPIIVSTQATQFKILARPAGASVGELASGSYFEYIAIGRWK